MKVYNEDKKSWLTKNLKVTKSFSERFLGLHKKSLPRSLLFNTRFGIHTFFLEESIDVVVLDRKNIVAEASSVCKNSIYIYNPKHKTVLEFPNGVIKKSKTKKGDKLNFIL